MKSIFFLIPLCLLLAYGAPAAEKTGQEGFQLHSVRAEFRQEKHLEILAAPIISTGLFIFQAPQSLRWEYRTPIRSLLLMHEGRLKKYVEQDGRLREETVGFDTMQVVLSEITNWLDGRFTDNRMFKVSFPDQKTVLLLPREKGIAALISSIELKLGDKKGLLDQVTIYEGPDSYTRLTFSNPVLNQEIPSSLFTER